MKVPTLLLASLAPIVTNAVLPQVQVETLYQFEDATFLENIAVRSNGHLLITTPVHPVVYAFDPKATNSTPQVLHEFPDATGLTGITEVAPDFFTLITSIFDETFTTTPGSVCVWTLDLRGSQPVVNKLVCLPDTVDDMLNGMTPLDHAPGVILISASVSGSVYRLNVATGELGIVIKDPLFAPGSAFHHGINGIHVRGETLYFINSAQGFFGLVPISLQGDQTGNVTKIVDQPPPGPSSTSGYDDFALDKDGNAWIAAHPNAVHFVTPAGELAVIAGGGDSIDLSDPTSAAFGRGSQKEEDTLYVTTAGLTRTGGQIVAIKIKRQ